MLGDTDSYTARTKLPNLYAGYRSSRKITPSINLSARAESQNRSQNSIRFRSPRASESLHKHLAIKYHRFSQEKARVSSRLQEIQEKISSVNEIKVKYGIKMSNQDIKMLKVRKLQDKAKIIYTLKLRMKAYNTIADWWRKQLIRKKIKTDKIITENAARLIQRIWKKYVVAKHAQALIKEMTRKKQVAATAVQKIFRGFQIRKIYSLQIKKRKMDRVFDYFKNIREHLHKTSVATISNAWLMYKHKTRPKESQNSLEKLDIYRNLSEENSKGQIASKLKGIILPKRSLDNLVNTRNEPESPIHNLIRLRSGTVDFIGITHKYVRPMS